MSYIEIKIGDQNIKWQYNMAAAAEVIEELKSKNQIIQTYALVYAGIFGYSVVEKKPCAFKWGDIIEMVDGMEANARGELVVQLTKAYLAAQPPAKEESKPQKETKKKNLPAKKRSTKT